MPDTNIVTFLVKKKTASSLSKLNKLTQEIYNEFSIQVELGDRKFSYAQPFFLSKTVMKPPEYPFVTLSDFFSRNKVGTNIDEYQQEGLLVLRSAIMNPYIYPMKQCAVQNLILEFMKELHLAASKSVKEI